MALICMNDVWGGQKPSRIYDLKGTTQHRYVADCEEPGAVLKDLNLVSHFFVKDPQVLEGVEIDGDFLMSEMSIDYSLLVGIDEGAGVVPHMPSLQNLQKLPTYTWYEDQDEDVEESGKFG